MLFVCLLRCEKERVTASTQFRFSMNSQGTIPRCIFILVKLAYGVNVYHFFAFVNVCNYVSLDKLI